MKKIILLSLATLLALSLLSCKKEIDPENPFPGYKIERLFFEYHTMTEVIVTLNAVVPKKPTKGVSFTILLSTDPEFPDDENLVTMNKAFTKFGGWRVPFKDLDPTKMYYCTAYYGDGTYKTQYPEVLSFQPGIIDLGLSVKWAVLNIGAETISDPGDYFAWGETEPKESYSGTNYTYNMTATSLTPEADVARVKWGGEWRMPTVEEIEELIENCGFMWTYYNGMAGLSVGRSEYPHRTIFFPAAGACLGTDIGSEAGKSGSIWASNSTSRDVGLLSYKYVGTGDEPIKVELSSSMRIVGRNVRAVCP